MIIGNFVILSIIIPTLNEEFYLPKLLTALSKQTFRDFEVIVVDGKSQDKTVFEAAKFIDRVPSLKIIEGVRGISRQRNLGARESQGEYFLFFDADVVPATNFLEVLMAEIKKRRIDCGMVFPRPQSPNLGTRIAATLGSLFLFGALWPFYKNTIGADFWLRREVFEEVGGFDEELTFAEDNDLLRRILKKGYSYRVLYKPKIYMSLRRFERDGYFKYILKSVISMVLIAIFGIKRTQKIISFEFGQHAKPKG